MEYLKIIFSLTFLGYEFMRCFGGLKLRNSNELKRLKKKRQKRNLFIIQHINVSVAVCQFVDSSAPVDLLPFKKLK